MEYTLMGGSTLEIFKERIKSLLAMGWRPQGGVCVTRAMDGSFFFHQAMTRGEQALEDRVAYLEKRLEYDDASKLD